MSILYVSLDTGNDIEEAYRNLMLSVLEDGAKVDTGHWQAVKDVPHTKTLELQNVVVEVPIPATAGAAASFFRPNLPWAEGHFQERVAGEPTNPGEWYDKWPWYKPGWEAQEGGQGRFSHTYQERFWPRSAGASGALGVLTGSKDVHGVRFRLGDLDDVVSLLDREPYTRQAYLPVWFPEDTGAHHGQRVPCTLGYHFMMRRDRLDCNYFIRSCDLVRYFKDDAYMAARLTQWIIDRLRDKELEPMDNSSMEVNGIWNFVQPGNLFMHIPSLHVFQAEAEALRRKYA